MVENGMINGKKERNSSIELLRVLCLLLIFWMHGAGSYENNEVSTWISIFANTIGNIGVSCFILISGYFGVKWQGKKMIRLDLMLIFYSWIGLLLEFLWGTDLGGEEMLSYILPVIGKRSWYFTCYFALVFLSPFINEMIEKLGRMRLKQLIVMMLVLFSGVTTFLFFDINGDGGKGIVHMVMMYLIGRYIGLYMQEQKYNTGKLAAAFVLVLGVNFALNGALYVVTGTVQNRFARDCTLFTIAEAVLAFLIFTNFHFKNGFVNRIAAYVPAVFIMEWTLRGAVRVYLFDYLTLSGDNIFEWVILGLGVFMIAAGSVIEALRRLIFDVPERKLVEILYRFWCRVYGIAAELLFKEEAVDGAGNGGK